MEKDIIDYSQTLINHKAERTPYNSERPIKFKKAKGGHNENN